MVKTCKIVPVFRKPVHHILPKNQVISAPSQLPLNDQQILRATMQATVYEVIAGRGDVLLTNQNRYSDNSKCPVVLNVPAIEHYYDAQGNEISKEKAIGDSAKASATNVQDPEDPAKEQSVDPAADDKKTDPAKQEDPVTPVVEDPTNAQQQVEDPTTPVEDKKSEDPAKEQSVDPAADDKKTDPAKQEDPVTPAEEQKTEGQQATNKNKNNKNKK